MGRTKSAATGKVIIDDVEKTNDTLTGRGGLTLFVRYLRNIDIMQQIKLTLSQRSCATAAG